MNWYENKNSPRISWIEKRPPRIFTVEQFLKKTK